MNRTINAVGALGWLFIMTAGVWDTFGLGPAAMVLGAALFGLGLAGLR